MLLMGLAATMKAAPVASDARVPDTRVRDTRVHDTETWLSDILESTQKQMHSIKMHGLKMHGIELQSIQPGRGVRDPWLDPTRQLPHLLPRAQKPHSPPLLVFASFSLPDKSLRALMEQTQRAGGALLLRGLVNNSFKATREAVAKLVEPLLQTPVHQSGHKRLKTQPPGLAGTPPAQGTPPAPGFSVNPKLFRLFEVTAAPTFVLLKAPMAPFARRECLTQDCPEAVPDHDRIAGNMSLMAALREMRTRGHYPEQAQAVLSRLEARPQEARPQGGTTPGSRPQGPGPQGSRP